MGISMSLSRRVSIALFAVLAELVAVAATGNQGVTNFVADHMATSPLGDLFLRSLPSFPWRITTVAQSGATTLLVSQYAAIATLFVLTFVLMLIIVRGAPTFSGPFFGGLTSVVFAALIAHIVANIIDYDWDGRERHLGLGRFGYSLFNSNDGLSIMFALMCGVVVAIVAGIVGVMLRRHAPVVPEPALFGSGLGAPTLEAAGFGPTESYAPPTQPWQTQESYPPPSYAPASYAPPSYAAQSNSETDTAAGDPSLTSYGTPVSDVGVDPAQTDPAQAAQAAQTAPAAPVDWVPPPEPHPSFAYPPSYHTEPLEPVPEVAIDEVPDAPVPPSGEDARSE
jgi:hypothetical protein